MTLKNNRENLLCYFKLYASFRSHRWIQARVTVRKRPIWVKIDDFFSSVTLQFDIWPWKTTGHLCCATSSFVHHFVAIGDFTLELQSGSAQFGPHRRFLEPCDLVIWRMTLKNNRTPLLFYFKLCASFRNHWCIRNLFHFVAESWWNMPFKGTLHGNVTEGAVAKLLQLWQRVSALWRHAVWIRIVTSYNAWMGYEYSLPKHESPKGDS